MRIFLAILLNLPMAWACAQQVAPPPAPSPSAVLSMPVMTVVPGPADRVPSHLEQTAYLLMAPVAGLHSLHLNLVRGPSGSSPWVAPPDRCPLPYLAAMAAGQIQLASCQYSPVTQRLSFGTLYLRDTATEHTARIEVRWERNYF